MDSNIQNILTILQEWTMGNIWSNLIFVFPKFTQAGHEQFERMLEENSKPNQLKKRVEDIRGFLIDLANANSWNITNIDENGIQTSRRLQNSDFDNIKYSALNVNQNKYCKIDDSGKISRRSHRLCWKMPEF